MKQAKSRQWTSEKSPRSEISTLGKKSEKEIRTRRCWVVPTTTTISALCPIWCCGKREHFNRCFWLARRRLLSEDKAITFGLKWASRAYILRTKTKTKTWEEREHLVASFRRNKEERKSEQIGYELQPQHWDTHEQSSWTRKGWNYIPERTPSYLVDQPSYARQRREG